MKAILGILFFMACAGGTFAQRICGSEEYIRQMLQANPSLQNAYNEAEKQIANATAKNNYRARDTIANEIINIPVVIHVLYKTDLQNISDVQIHSQLDALNNDYSKQNADRANTPAVFKHLAADIRIKFCLAQVDPQNKKTNGIIRKYTNADNFSADDAMKHGASGGDDAWDNKKYLNIWVCTLGGRSLGYATPPGGPASLDGVVIGYDVFGTVGNLRPVFNKGRTATHEIGHWLGLKHIWGDTDCGDDGVDDTPPQKSYNFGCPSFPHVTSCSVDANGDMFMNYMDFSDDACMNMFTTGQKKRMRALFANGNIRNSFLTSFACDSTLIQGSPVATPDSMKPAAVAAFAKLYPNPVQSSVTIECKSASKLTVKAIRIFNITGMKVFSAQLDKEKSSFNLSFLTTGIYFIKIGEAAETFITKFFKQ